MDTDRLFHDYSTTSAYERYWEGRRLWSQIIINARTMARVIWVHCPDTMIAELPETGWESKEAEEEDRRKAIREKRRAVELCLAFAVAVKHCESTAILLIDVD
jgi:putative membrane protein